MIENGRSNGTFVRNWHYDQGYLEAAAFKWASDIDYAIVGQIGGIWYKGRYVGFLMLAGHEHSRDVAMRKILARAGVVRE